MANNTSAAPVDRRCDPAPLPPAEGNGADARPRRWKALFSGASQETRAQATLAGEPPESRWRSLARYAGAVLAVATVTLLAHPLLGHLDLANIVMLFLLSVLFAAVRLGRGPAVVAAFLSVAALDVFFVLPHFTFAVADAQYLVTFVVMLIVALLTGQLTAGLRFELAMAGSRQRRTQALYEMARELSAALAVEQIAEICERFVTQGFNAGSRLLLPDRSDRLTVVEGGAVDLVPELDVARRVYEAGEAATPDGASTSILYLPLRATMRTRGVLAIAPRVPAGPIPAEQRQLIETCATLIAVALERVHYITVAQEAQLQMESERLRNSLLAALSHDLRTPLTALVGLADALVMGKPPLQPAPAELAGAIRDEALRTSALVNNLLEMARLQSGDVRLRREWQPLEEVVGAALKARASVLGGHRVRLDLPAELPLVEFDAVLVERVLCNLLENAAKYTPPGSCIEIAARQADGLIEVVVADDGPGLPPGHEAMLFQKFARGRGESSISGVGLGLAIARAIVESHGGTIGGENRPGGGARFVFTLPAGKPPSVPEELS